MRYLKEDELPESGPLGYVDFTEDFLQWRLDIGGEGEHLLAISGEFYEIHVFQPQIFINFAPAKEWTRKKKKKI